MTSCSIWLCSYYRSKPSNRYTACSTIGPVGDLLLHAFRTIDSDNVGYISAEYLEELLTTRGTPFRPKEIDAFLSVARDPETGNIYYEDYVALLMKNNNQS